MMRVLVIGASRGLGLEFARQYRQAGDHVVATARSDDALARLRGLGCEAWPLDLLDAASVAALGWRLDGQRFDAVIFNAGVYGPRTQGLETPTQDDFDAVMRTNVLGPMRVLPQLEPVLAQDAKLMVLSSMMGSIGQRSTSTGWLYRASKAALNSVLRDVALALGPRGITCVAVHPGWVRTDMGGAHASLAPEDSVARLRQLLARLRPEDNGHFLHYDGTPIAW
ncbi:SDR family oxidoreductase [Caldimonas manganoxidans]|uniref:SDR family oxidoreductase n=1 Tax=Caldimonas manganoxidans TaxID=196015 RepID=UPI000365495D|nr:SDR family oxidoreductase [Caldimonas manganoxidans]